MYYEFDNFHWHWAPDFKDHWQVDHNGSKETVVNKPQWVLVEVQLVLCSPLQLCSVVSELCLEYFFNCIFQGHYIQHLSQWTLSAQYLYHKLLMILLCHFSAQIYAQRFRRHGTHELCFSTITSIGMKRKLMSLILNDNWCPSAASTLSRTWLKWRRLS